MAHESFDTVLGGRAEVTIYPGSIGLDLIPGDRPFGGVFQDIDADTARDLATYILENLPQPPTPPTARDVFDSLPIGAQFILDGTAVRVKVSDTKFFNTRSEQVFDADFNIPPHTRIKVVS